MTLARAFDVQRNAIHIISLSCNPVPPLRYGGIELVIAHLCEGLKDFGAHVICYSPGDFAIPGAQHFQTLSEPSLHIKEGGIPNTEAHLLQVAAGLKRLSKPGDIIIFNHADQYRFLKQRLGLIFLLRHRFVEVAHWIDAGLQKNIIYPSLALKLQINRPGIVIPHGEKLLFDTAPHKQRENFIFFAGRITKDKGVDIALEACRELSIPLLLAGPLNDRVFAQPILQDPVVTYLGELTYPELFEYYRKAKAMVYMTQYTEPFGLSVIEAMAAGCPVITTGRGGTGETVIDGRTGFLCQSVDDIVHAVSKLGTIKSKDCVERAKFYTIRGMARAYLDFFATI